MGIVVVAAEAAEPEAVVEPAGIAAVVESAGIVAEAALEAVVYCCCRP